ncbi:MAG: hypothetical protein R6V13_05995 [Anaerolineae bacterium]
MAMSIAPDAEVETILSKAAEALGVSEKDVLEQGVRALLERRLRDVKSQIFEISGRYGVSSVREMEEQYREGTLEEADSWRDLQRLDHLEYERERLQELTEMLP